MTPITRAPSSSAGRRQHSRPRWPPLGVPSAREKKSQQRIVAPKENGALRAVAEVWLRQAVSEGAKRGAEGRQSRRPLDPELERRPAPQIRDPGGPLRCPARA